MGNASGNPYSGGELGLMPVAGGSISLARAMVMTRISIWELRCPSIPVAGPPTISPTNNPVYAGTPVT